MKTNKIKIFFSIISFCFLVTSCNNLLSELTQQKTYIQISTNLGNTNQRTVLPDFSVVQENGYTWELYKGGILFQTWNDANGKSAYQNMCESKIEVDPGSYSFELKVIKEDKIILKSESQTVTIEQNKNNELNFVLYPPTENEAYGSVNFILKFPNEKVNIVKAYLFKPVDDGKEVAVGNMEDVAITTEGSSSTANITVNNVPKGSYLLQVDLCYKVDEYSSTETINTYTTIVQVAAGFCSKAKVTLEELTDYYTITYMVDDDIITTFKGSNVIPTTFKKNSNVELPIAYNDGQLSIGWFNDPDCTDPVELNDNKFTITENTTLYTQWGNVVNTNDLSFGAIDTTNNIEGLLIKTETGLNYFRNIVNGTLNENIIVSDDFVYRKGTPYPTVNAKLCDDIELSTVTDWVPIGNGKYEGTTNNIYYEGSFDGNGKGVINLNINSDDETDLGFFGCVQDATIKNLYVQGNISATKVSDYYAVGGIVGYAKSSDGNSVTISNCINNVQIDSQSTFVGGFLGNLANIGRIEIESCVNIADLTAQYPSGILNISGNSIIKNCLNLGNLTSTSTFNNTAGICMTYNVNCTVSNCINTGKIILSDDLINNSVYPIQRYTGNSQGSPTCLECYYDSTILPTVNDVPGVLGIPSSDFDTLDLECWDYPVSESKYPIPTAIKDTFEENTSCWEIILQAANIEASPGDVSGAYYVKGDGDDNNDGSSRTSPKKNLTNVITSLKDSPDNLTRTIYIDGTLTAESQGVTTQKSGNEGALVYIMDGEGCQDAYKITIKGINNALLDAEYFAKFFATYGNLNLRIEDVEFINGKTTASGGAFFFYGSILELDNCKISNCSSTYETSPESYTGIYMCGTSVLNMTNTTCKNSIYLAKTTATIGSNCTIGTSDTTATDGFITLDESTLKLDGKNIVIYKPIYINNQDAKIELGNDFEKTDSKIQIKINPLLLSGFTLFENPPANLPALFELVESEGFTLNENGQIIEN